MTMSNRQRENVLLAVKTIKEAKEAVEKKFLKFRTREVQISAMQLLVRELRKDIHKNQQQDTLQEKQSIAERIKEHTLSDGYLYLYVWGRDCDLVESSSVIKIKPTVVNYQNAVNDVYDSAEGPTHVSIMTQKDVDEYEPVWHDLGMEIFENRGYGH